MRDYPDYITERDILIMILETLKAMKQQEHDYWEVWKRKNAQ